MIVCKRSAGGGAILHKVRVVVTIVVTSLASTALGMACVRWCVNEVRRVLVVSCT